MVNRVNVDEVKNRMESGECQIVDVREYSEYAAEHVAGSRLAPLSSLDSNMGDVDGTKPVYLMCRSGKRAGMAADKLSQKGFSNLYVIDGGMTAWSAANLPVEKGQSNVWSLERQVRFAAGSIVLAGTLLGAFVSTYFYLVPAFIGTGLVFSAVTDTCGMGMALARMPWNKAPSQCGTTN